jgi:hypothetical protein
MKNLLKSSTLFLIILIMVSGCRKDPESPIIVTDCQDFPASSEFGWSYIKLGDQFLAPCYNPNNSNEFLFLKETEGVSYPSLYIYDIVNATQTLLCDSQFIISQPQWGKNGWIVFGTFEGGQRIWKIHEEGYGLEEITDFQSVDPVISPDGNRFICMGKHPDILGEYRPIMDLDGNLIDSIRLTFGDIAIGNYFISTDGTFHNSYQLYANHATDKTGFCRLVDNNSIIELNSFDYQTIHSAAANSNFLFYTSHWGGFYKIDLNTLVTSVYKQGCDTKFYYYISMSPDKDRMLVEKVTSTVLNEAEIDEKHEIWMMDMNGEEIKILGN